MGILNDDAVVIKQPQTPGENTLITVNCPDKTGLGSDLCRIILLFGLSIAKGGIFTITITIIVTFFFDFFF